MNLDEKLNNLKNNLKSLKSAVVAFSSGVDSTFLLKVAHSVLKDNLIAVTLKSSCFPEKELVEAVEFCKNEGIKHIILDVDILQIKGFDQNPPDRCYLCKKELFQKIWQTAKENNIKNVLEGSNKDDEGDYRPGLVAVKELKVKSPLREFKKDEIRTLSKKLGLKTFDKPSFACLASRFVYGEKITKEKLLMVNKAEEFLLNKGFKQVRVRIHKDIARIEVLESEFEKILSNSKEIDEKLKNLGFKYVSLDLKGYRTGSMNETLNM